MDTLKSSGLLWLAFAESFDIHSRTIQSFKNRLEGEGLPFLLVTLPQLGKEVDRALITGEALSISSRFSLKSDSRLPEFLYDLFSKVFTDDGFVRELVDPIHIKYLRQLTLLGYKTEVPYAQGIISTAIDSFRIREEGLSKPLPAETRELRRARGLICRVLMGLDPHEIIPRHSNGATACRTPNCDKYHSFRYYPRLNAEFEYSEYFFASATHLCDELTKLTECEVGEEPVGRLVCIPKDARGPRIICCEPLEHQYIQQGLMSLLYKRIESHPLTRGFVSFTDQTINRELARESSITLSKATLDLKDASDLVRWDLVQYLFPTEWVRAMDACRTRYIEMPDGSIVGPLAKFAPMGSSLCFPVESLVFWALLKAHLNCDVNVYGDDIILDTCYSKQAIDTLEAYSLRVNGDKSCYRTPFRESCGGDYYHGVDVGYVKLRSLPVESSDSKVAMIEFANLVNSAYGEMVGIGIRDWTTAHYGPVFCSSDGSPTAFNCGPRASNDVFFKRRWHPDYQEVQYLRPAIVVPTLDDRTAPPNHWGELLRKFCAWDPVHYTLGVYADPERRTVKFRWSGEAEESLLGRGPRKGAFFTTMAPKGS